MGTLKGIIPVIPTPFTDDGKYVDYGNFEDIGRHGRERWSSMGFVFLAAGAEFYKLTNGREKRTFSESASSE